MKTFLTILIIILTVMQFAYFRLTILGLEKIETKIDNMGVREACSLVRSGLEVLNNNKKYNAK